MQLLDFDLNLSQANTTILRKIRIPVSEAVLLRAMHGSQSITNIEVVGELEIDPVREKQRLMARYHRERPREMIEKLFPGLAPKLPETIEDAGLQDFLFGVKRAPKEDVADEFLDTNPEAAVPEKAAKKAKPKGQAKAETEADQAVLD